MEGLVVRAPAGEVDGDCPREAIFRDKGHPVQVRALGTVVAPGLCDLAVVIAVIVLVVEGPPGSAGQLKADIAQALSGGILAEVVEVGLIKGNTLAGADPVGDGIVPQVLPYLDLHRAVKALASSAPAGEFDH